MKRNFVIEIVFRGMSLSAFVKMYQLRTETGYCIDYLNEEVEKIIPGRKVLVGMSNRSVLRYSHPDSKDLIDATVDSITAHLISELN